MALGDVVLLIISATLANHLGLIGAIEKVIRHKIPVLNCSRCLTCWCCLAYLLIVKTSPIVAIATSFIASYLAVWLELLCGYIDTLYDEIYESIYAEKTNSAADTEDEVS